MQTWFEIQFADGATGYIRLIDGWSQGVYRADGTSVGVEEVVEYTCINDNATAPVWYFPPQE